MNLRQLGAAGAIFAALAGAASAKLTPEQVAKLPAPSAAPVDFVRDVKPIFDAACVKCHGKGKDKGGFSLETRETFHKGGDSGPAILAGQSAQSLLIELVSGLDPENVMPKKGSKLKPEQVSLLRAWIDQGANWPADVTFKKTPVNNLIPRRVDLPVVKGLENPVDRLLAGYFSVHRLPSAKPVDDRTFARRVCLDVIGLLLTPAELNAFLTDKSADKRARLVANLLSDQRRYAEHWMTFWNDLLRNDYKGTGYIDGGRHQISTWLFSALYTNKPYNQFVAELINPGVKSDGFVNGISWRGAVNASQKPVMQAAQSIGQVFLGVNLKCASCHDSFINDYTLADSYGIAAIYATNALEIAECDKPTGKFAKVKFLYSELGEIDGSLPKPERARQLADVLTSKKDGRLTRTIVNRLWAKFMGHGLVEPVDEMDSPAWNADVLDWLSEDLADNGYDLKRTMKWILTSRVYQLPSVNLGEQTGKDFVFAGPAIRRLDAEQFRDALGEMTGVWQSAPSSSINLAAAVQSKEGALPESAKWIWSQAGAEKNGLAETIHLRKTFSLSEIPEEAFAAISCDNSFTLWLNGTKVAGGNDLKKPNFVDLKPHLRTGTNVLAVSAVNHTPDNKPPRPDDVPKEGDRNPAGFFFAALLPGGRQADLVSDGSWLWSRTVTNGWNQRRFDDHAWQPAVELGDANMAPWILASKLEQALFLAEIHGAVRASLVAADPLMVALGRPNREQVMTSRQSAATTLQGLELTNGETLDKILKQGAEKLIADKRRTAGELVADIFVKSLGRKPTKNELKIATELVGSPTRQEGVEDLLWSVAMLPEFQLIY